MHGVAGGNEPDRRPGEKCPRRHKPVRIVHVMGLETEVALTITLQEVGFSGRLNTACGERVNLMVQHGVAVLARSTWAKAQQSP